MAFFGAAFEKYLEINGWKRCQRPGMGIRYRHPADPRTLCDLPTAVTRTLFNQDILGRPVVSVTIHRPMKG